MGAMRRREFLRVGAGCALSAASGLTRPSRAAADPLPAVPRVNGAINIQPLRRFERVPSATPPLIVPELVDLQMRALYELGFEAIRLTISFNRFGPDFLAAIPYARAARALGIDVLGVMMDFAGFDLVQALSRRPTRVEVLDAYLAIFDGIVAPASSGVARTGSFALQVLNEPTHFLGLSPDAYVRQFLAPVYDDLKEKAPELLVVSAAEVGTLEGYLRVRTMFETGLESFCDRVAYHVYSRLVIPLFAGLAHKPVWVTESGVEGTENHLGWVRDVFPEIRRVIGGVERVFYYELFDFEPRRFRLLDIVPDPELGFRPVVESTALFDDLSRRVTKAMGGAPHAGYRDLVPDIRAYFPTPADLEVIASATSARS